MPALSSAIDRLKRWAMWAMVWTIIVLIYSFRLDARGLPVAGWRDGLKIAAAQDFWVVAARSVLRSNAWVYWVLLSLFAAFEYQKHGRERDLETAHLERLLAQTRLAALQAPTLATWNARFGWSRLVSL